MTSRLSALRPHAWALYVAVYLAVLVPSAQLPFGLEKLVSTQVLAWSGVILMIGRLLRDRPRRAGALWVLTVGAAVWVLGVFVFFVFQPPSPGPHDVLYLLGCGSAIVGMVLLVRQRVPGRNRESLLDAAIVSCGIALLSCVFLIKPVAGVTGSTFGTFVAMAYPVLDVFVLALLVSLLLGGGLGSSAMRLVALAYLCAVVADVGLALGFTDFDSFSGRLLTVVGVLIYGMFGAAALHPGFTNIVVDSPPGGSNPPWLRTPLVWTAVMAGPGLLLFEAWQYRRMVPDALAIAVGCIVIFGLVVVRLQLLVKRVNSQTVVLSQQAERLHVLASRDELTGLANRREWDQTLSRALRQAGPDDVISVVLIDLDYFKRYNDTFGHQAGDRLLKASASAWMAQLRGSDILARYGGEEFIALFPGCGATTAEMVVQRLRAVTPEGQAFSAGIATWDTCESPDRLVARADVALYQAKNAGRDQWIVAETDLPAPGSDGLMSAADRSVPTVGDHPVRPGTP